MKRFHIFNTGLTNKKDPSLRQGLPYLHGILAKLDRLRTSFTCANAYNFLQVLHEDLAITDLSVFAMLSSADDRVNNEVFELVIASDQDLDLRD